MGFNLIYCTPMGGSYVLSCSNLEKYGKCGIPGGYGRIGEILHGRIWLDWRNTAWADMAGLGSIGDEQSHQVFPWSSSEIQVHAGIICYNW